MTEPENLVLSLMREMRAEMKDMRADMATKGDIARIENTVAEVNARVTSLAAAVASDLLTTEKRLSDQIVGLRRAVVEYHSAVIGHGVIISELEARVRRIEQNLGLSSIDPN